MPKFHLDKIDSVRGIAILLVLSFHTQLILFPTFQNATYNNKGILLLHGIKDGLLKLNPAAFGWMGVPLFLIISGFLIHLIYLKNESKFDLKLFFSKRFWRIYPPYFLTLLFFYIKSKDFSSQGYLNFFSHVFLVHNFNDKTFFSINGVLWTVALEIQLYLLYPIYLKILNFFGSKKTVVIMFFISLIFKSTLYVFYPNSLTVGFFVLNYWFTWCLGAYLADCFYHSKKVFTRPIIWFFLFSLIILFCEIFSGSVHIKYLQYLLMPFYCVAIIESVLYNEYIDKYFITKYIFKFLSFTGIISYSIYLIHQPFLYNLLSFFNPLTHKIWLNTSISVFFSWLILFLISYSLYKLLESKSIQIGQLLRSKIKG